MNKNALHTAIRHLPDSCKPMYFKCANRYIKDKRELCSLVQDMCGRFPQWIIATNANDLFALDVNDGISTLYNEDGDVLLVSGEKHPKELDQLIRETVANCCADDDDDEYWYDVFASISVLRPSDNFGAIDYLRRIRAYQFCVAHGFISA